VCGDDPTITATTATTNITTAAATNNNIIPFMSVNVPSQQLESQLQERHIAQTYVIKDNKQGTHETCS
jgi:hypothetical protein